jgi:hypothetical protein
MVNLGLIINIITINLQLTSRFLNILKSQINLIHQIRVSPNLTSITILLTQWHLLRVNLIKYHKNQIPKS